ncbi:MAG: right-handed parallel beta-helix repeat-containing protein [Elusimicrobia bacterium]|nr:right-handed parallel beta-helix repeat-containing protein [Elusimicrobiota bacterium]
MAAVLLLLLALSPARATCPAANPNDAAPDDAALQACLDRGGKIELGGGRPGYILRRGLTLGRSGTELTSADPSRPARLKAHPDLFAFLLQVQENTHGWTLRSVIFDGNLAERRRARDCKGYRGFGTNVQFQGSNFKIVDVESTGALCGSALEGKGTDFEIAGCRIHDNGRSADEAPGVPEPWADGLTIWNCDRGSVHDNALADNTDVGLIVGGGKDCRVERNTVEQRRAYAYAGINVGHFGGDHPGSIYRRNTVVSGKDKTAFGLIVGAHPWDAKLVMADAGTVTENTIRGAVVNLAIDGIAKGRVAGNTFVDPQGTQMMGSCRKGANYTAAHFGRATIEPRPKYRSYHEGDCQDLKRPNGAVFVRQKVPKKLDAGETGKVELTFRNSGHEPWTAAGGFALGSQAPRDNQRFRSGRVRLSPGTRIEPGETLTWTFAIKAPREPGTYTFQWRMVRERVEWFGHPSKPVDIRVE